MSTGVDCFCSLRLSGLSPCTLRPSVRAGVQPDARRASEDTTMARSASPRERKETVAARRRPRSARGGIGGAPAEGLLVVLDVAFLEDREQSHECVVLIQRGLIALLVLSPGAQSQRP